MATPATAAGTTDTGAPPKEAVVMSAGINIQSEVAKHPPGTTYYLWSGVHRLQSIQPKDGDTFIGAKDAILSGAKLLTNFKHLGAVYVASDLPIDPSTTITGECLADYPRCGYPQDVYFDDAPLRAVTSITELSHGNFFYDYEANRVLITDDPAGHTVELSYRPVAFSGTAKNVTVKNLVIEKYASANGQAALGNHGEGENWTMTDNEVRLNHGYGINAGNNSSITNNIIHHNGQAGLTSENNTKVDKNEIAQNVWSGARCDDQCGGGKWSHVSNVKITDNDVHDNIGNGLETNENSSDILFENNSIENNLLSGIEHTNGKTTIIKNNTLKGNGATGLEDVRYSQINIQNASGTEISGNSIIFDGSKGSDGITLDLRKEPGQPAYTGNIIHDNDFTMLNGHGVFGGWSTDETPEAFAATNNKFEANHYHVASKDEPSAVWNKNKSTDFKTWKAAGMDAKGTIDNDMTKAEELVASDEAPPAESCGKNAESSSFQRVIKNTVSTTDAPEDQCPNGGTIPVKITVTQNYICDNGAAMPQGEPETTTDYSGNAVCKGEDATGGCKDKTGKWHENDTSYTVIVSRKSAKTPALAYECPFGGTVPIKKIVTRNYTCADGTETMMGTVTTEIVSGNPTCNAPRPRRTTYKPKTLPAR
jgi:parallel beta-helix repeat protein